MLFDPRIDLILALEGYQIATLESKLMKSNALFGQYKESMRSDMLSEISTAKKAALLKIIDSGTVTQELRQRAIKIAAVEDEISDLKRDNGRLKYYNYYMHPMLSLFS